MNFYLIKSKIYDDVVGYPISADNFIIAAESMSNAVERFNEYVDKEYEIETLTIERLNAEGEPYLHITEECAKRITTEFILY